jgi:hypothetical protein
MADLTRKNDGGDSGLRGLPQEILNRCSEIAGEIRRQNLAVRDKKIMAARIRITSGYYDSDDILDIIASRMLSESSTQRDPS